MAEGLSPGLALLVGVLVSLSVIAGVFLLYVSRTNDSRRSTLEQLRAFRTAGLQRTGVALAATGVLSMLAAVALCLVVRPEGRLVSEGLFTLRAPGVLEVNRLIAGDEIDAGAQIAWFHSPVDEAARASLRLRRDALDAERRVVLNQPLEPDPKLVERQREIEAEDRHLRAAAEQMVIENSAVRREKVRSVLEAKRQIVQLGGRLAQLPREL